jgi:hypothetical protein
VSQIRTAVSVFCSTAASSCDHRLKEIRISRQQYCVDRPAAVRDHVAIRICRRLLLRRKKMYRRRPHKQFGCVWSVNGVFLALQAGEAQGTYNVDGPPKQLLLELLFTTANAWRTKINPLVYWRAIFTGTARFKDLPKMKFGYDRQQHTIFYADICSSSSSRLLTGPSYVER